MDANASSPLASIPRPDLSGVSPYVKEVIKHRALVMRALACMENELWKRGMSHDSSKFDEEEYDLYAGVQDEWAKHPYGSEGYRTLCKRIAPAIEHHVHSNRHHPEYFENGVAGMTLVDLFEMACDWYAASKRAPGSDIRQTLPISLTRFNIEPQLASILANTMEVLIALVGDWSLPDDDDDSGPE